MSDTHAPSRDKRARKTFIDESVADIMGLCNDPHARHGLWTARYHAGIVVEPFNITP
jgi:hypothetical protein